MEYAQSFLLNNDFRTCLYNLMEHGTTVNPRGSLTKEILNYNITLNDPRNRIITFPERKTSTKYLLGELVWYLSGSSDPDGILPYSKFWDNIRNSDGSVNSNYGNRMFGHFQEAGFVGINQWKNTIELLQHDKDTRQAIMNIHVPNDRSPNVKDIPCTIALQWFIRDNRLHLIVNMRSNDLVLGFTNDVFQFTMLQECMMHELRSIYPDLQLGHYYHNTGSMHIYSRHFEMAQEILQNVGDEECIMSSMDAWNEEIRLSLISLKQKWEYAGMNKEFNFTKCHEWNNLTPYWQTLVLLCFGNRTEILNSWVSAPVEQ
ncbi:MAG: Thymidylate synthase 1 [Syntrophomonadaceae bacterium]|nr:Thymidylate synthase 1 [Bacillota bacterium]